ncbi:MAG: 30S ribosome-binding factor RbfA [Gemmatimonadetes bacterium]|nr:30S ribosome-binding factor RbfA [Gemmatimonadota bacterium]MBI2537581.1 30S ribosome-binding factor RbfA [Gemmatimonadota bacterium]
MAALLRETLAEALATHVKDPRVGFVTLTGVTVSLDGSHAAIRVSVMGTEDQKAGALAGLESARGFLRTHLAGALSLRTVPELHFQLDRGLEHAQRINQLLAQLKRSDASS